MSVIEEYNSTVCGQRNDFSTKCDQCLSPQSERGKLLRHRASQSSFHYHYLRGHYSWVSAIQENRQKRRCAVPAAIFHPRNEVNLIRSDSR